MDFMLNLILTHLPVNSRLIDAAHTDIETVHWLLQQ